MLIRALYTNFESTLYCPISRILSRLETSSTTRFEFIHAPQYAFHIADENLNLPEATRGMHMCLSMFILKSLIFCKDEPVVTRGAVESGAIDRTEVIPGFQFRRTYPTAGQGPRDVAILTHNDSGGLNDVEEFDDNADMLIDGLGDASMSSRGTTRIEGEYLDGVESHKIPDHTMFLRTIARPHIRPVLIVEVKRFTFLRTRRATVVDDLDYDIFGEDVEIRATGVIKSTIKQLKQQLACVFGEFGPDMISFVDALIVVGPYYQRYTVQRPTPLQDIHVEFNEDDIKRIFKDDLSDMSEAFYEDWKAICRSHELHTL